MHTFEEMKNLQGRITKNHQDWVNGNWGPNEIEFMAKLPEMFSQLISWQEGLEEMARDNVALRIRNEELLSKLEQYANSHS